MTSETITLERIETLATYLGLAARRVAEIRDEAEKGDIDPAAGAAEIAEIMANLNAAAK